MTLIKCENLNLGYEGSAVVKDVSFSIEEGDYLCIVGPNGAGKTTIIKGLLGLIAPLSGKIELAKGLKRETGYLPQITACQKDFPATVQEVVMSGFAGILGLSPFYRKEWREKAESMMEDFGISALKLATYSDLSVGQRQKVLLARALCADGRMLFLDEPAASLDPGASMEFYSLIDRINKERNVTIVMISHDLEATFKYSNKILHVAEGIKFFGDTEEYKKTSLYEELMGGKQNA